MNSLARDTYLSEEERLKEAGSMAVLRGRMAPTEVAIRRDEWRNEIVTKRKKLEHVTSLCARRNLRFPSRFLHIGVYRTFG